VKKGKFVHETVLVKYFKDLPTWGPFLESPDNFSGYSMGVKFTLKIQILLVFKAKK